MQPITLHPVQSVTITILADNFFDGLLLDQGVAKRASLGTQNLGVTTALMVVATRDTIAPTDLALAAYERALQSKRLAMYAGDHFDAYVAAFETTSAAATEWFREHLGEGQQELKR